MATAKIAGLIKFIVSLSTEKDYQRWVSYMQVERSLAYENCRVGGRHNFTTVTGWCYKFVKYNILYRRSLNSRSLWRYEDLLSNKISRTHDKNSILHTIVPFLAKSTKGSVSILDHLKIPFGWNIFEIFCTNIRFALSICPCAINLFLPSFGSNCNNFVCFMSAQFKAHKKIYHAFERNNITYYKGII